MKFKIHNRIYDDYIVVEGETIEEIREIVKIETCYRGWEKENCWSEEVKDEKSNKR